MNMCGEMCKYTKEYVLDLKLQLKILYFCSTFLKCFNLNQNMFNFHLELFIRKKTYMFSCFKELRNLNTDLKNL